MTCTPAPHSSGTETPTSSLPPAQPLTLPTEAGWSASISHEMATLSARTIDYQLLTSITNSPTQSGRVGLLSFQVCSTVSVQYVGQQPHLDTGLTSVSHAGMWPAALLLASTHCCLAHMAAHYGSSGEPLGHE